MKKQYISPEILSFKLRLDCLLNGASITKVEKGDLTNDIIMGGEAESGIGSDSRRRDIWADDEEEYEY